MLDDQGKIIYSSPSLGWVLGYPPQELIGRKIADFVHPKDLAGVNYMLGVARQEVGVPMCAEFRFRHKDDSWRYLESVCHMVMEGGWLYDVLTSRDFTSRKRIEQTLRASQERLQLIADNISDLVTLVDLHGIRQSVSPSHTRILGYRPPELVGKPITSLIHPEDVEQVNAAVARAIQTGELQRVEFRTRHAEGHYLWQEGIGKVIFDERGVPVGASITSRDITERKRAEEVLARYAALVESSDDAILSMTLDGIITSWNVGAEGLYGYSNSSSFDLRVTLDVLLDQVTAQLGVDAADVLRLNPHLHTLEFAAKRGFHSTALEQTHLRLGEGYAGLAALERRLIRVPDLGEDQTNLASYLERVGERFVNYFAVPLIVLDNFEQVLAAASLVAELLTAAPDLKILITSREPLDLYGEHEFRVSPLPVPDLAQRPTPETLAPIPSVALFVERAQAVKPEFQLTPTNTLAVAAICVRLDGLPLALELAAAQIKHLNPEELAAHLVQHLCTWRRQMHSRG